MKEKCIKKRPIYLGKSVDFHSDFVRLPNGKKAVREYIGHPGAVAVLPFIDMNTILMVKQYRYPVGAFTLEIPAGKIDRGEKILRCVKRELLEETGYTASHFRKITSFWPTPAFSNEILHIYSAEGLRQGTAAPDADEFLKVVRLPYAEALRWALRGKIKDSKTVIALLSWILRNYIKKRAC